MTKPIIVVGMQWGDEGKGKIVDYLAKAADYVVRFNGGDNAGHTVVSNGRTYKFHNLPSGAVAGKKLLIAQGEVINPKILLKEIEELKLSGIKIDLKIDPRVHIVMPYHQLLDQASEIWKGSKKTGSLKLGIGFCYEDKNNRLGIRLEDLIRPNILKDKVNFLFPFKKAVIEKVYGQTIDITAKEIIIVYLNYGKKLKPYMADVVKIVFDNLGSKNMIFETAHGTFLDPAFGTYPYTVAPHSIAAAAFTGIGIGPVSAEIIGVMKAYTTRVGNGPFPTEQDNAIGQILQKQGLEYGTTSGRIRRCGWLDIPLLRSAVMFNGVTQLCLTKLDVLSNLSAIMVATHYRCRGKKLKYFPAEVNLLSEIKPVYKKFMGWQTDISKIKYYSDLPENCLSFLKFLEQALGVPIKFISVSPERSAVIRH